MQLCRWEMEQGTGRGLREVPDARAGWGGGDQGTREGDQGQGMQVRQDPRGKESWQELIFHVWFTRHHLASIRPLF